MSILRKLDANRDGKLTAEALWPAGQSAPSAQQGRLGGQRGGVRPGGGQAGRGGAGAGGCPGSGGQGGGGRSGGR